MSHSADSPKQTPAPDVRIPAIQQSTADDLANAAAVTGNAHVNPSTPPEGATTAAQISNEPLPENNDIEAEESEHDSANATSIASETTSLNPRLYKGYIENGRRYQGYNKGAYWGPADDSAFDAMNMGHAVMVTMDCQAENPLFRSRLSEKAQHVLDIGTGDGSWAIDVADRFPQLTVHGIDLYPPQVKWMPPNCFLEVDAAEKEWTWTHKMDFIHLRWMTGSFTIEEWRRVYAQAYKKLQPGGWIEQVELCPHFKSDDGTLPPGSQIAKWGTYFESFAEKAGKPMNVYDTMRSGIEEAGFVNVQEKLYKLPMGAWARHPIYKDAGRLNAEQFKTGIDGFAPFLFTKFGEWSLEETQAYTAAVKEELKNKKLHVYNQTRRVWAQKPL